MTKYHTEVEEEKQVAEGSQMLGASFRLDHTAPRPGWVTRRHLLLTALQAGSPKSRYRPTLCLVRGVAGWQGACFSFCAHAVEWESRPLLIRTRVPSQGCSQSWPYLNLSISHVPRLRVPPYEGLGPHVWISGEHRHSVHSRKDTHILLTEYSKIDSASTMVV